MSRTFHAQMIHHNSVGFRPVDILKDTYPDLTFQMYAPSPSRPPYIGKSIKERQNTFPTLPNKQWSNNPWLKVHLYLPCLGS